MPAEKTDFEISNFCNFQTSMKKNTSGMVGSYLCHFKLTSDYHQLTTRVGKAKLIGILLDWHQTSRQSCQRLLNNCIFTKQL